MPYHPSRPVTSPVPFGYSETSSSASASYGSHDAPTDAASPLPCFPACSTSTPVHLLHAHASVSPDTQESDSLLQILQQMCLEGYALTTILA